MCVCVCVCGADAVCYGTNTGRPLQDVIHVKSVEKCLEHAKNYKYFAHGCPSSSNGFECWRGNAVSSKAKKLDMKECTGTPLTDIGNGKNNGGCHGYPQGKFTIPYKGVQVPLGGWHREPVFLVSNFVSGLCWVYLCVCVCVCV